MPFRQSPLIEVRRIPKKGRGVFAKEDLEEGTEIERVPVLVFPASEIPDDVSSMMGTYCFYWSRGKVALALGYGSIYNHSFTPNAIYADLPNQTKVFRALRFIRRGEEITINYNGDVDDHSQVGFCVLE